MLKSVGKISRYEEHEQLDSGDGGALQGMMEDFMDMLYSCPKTSSSVHQKAVLTAFLYM